MRVCTDGVPLFSWSALGGDGEDEECCLAMLMLPMEREERWDSSPRLNVIGLPSEPPGFIHGSEPLESGHHRTQKINTNATMRSMMHWIGRDLCASLKKHGSWFQHYCTSQSIDSEDMALSYGHCDKIINPKIKFYRSTNSSSLMNCSTNKKNTFHTVFTKH